MSRYTFLMRHGVEPGMIDKMAIEHGGGPRSSLRTWRDRPPPRMVGPALLEAQRIGGECAVRGRREHQKATK
jgi:hypothetical protein